MSVLGEAIVKIGADNAELKAKINESSQRLEQLEKKFSTTTGNSAKSVGGLSSVVGGLGGVIAGAFSVGAVISFGQKIIETTATFQRLDAVLTNTLGSQEASNKAFADIKDFAAKTNFSVIELTDSYVKLTNQNLQPSMEQMTHYADIANATGKTFDQLTEAIIDATTGQFERLKEFGILASKNGDKVKFSFKGVTTETNFTSDAIGNYIDSLGTLEGVSGATAKISETLGGKISNLGDSADTLYNALGTQGDGIFTFFIKGMQNSLEEMTSFIENAGKITDVLSAGGLSKGGAFDTMVLDGVRDIVLARHKEMVKSADEMANSMAESFIKAGKGGKPLIDELQKSIKFYAAAADAANAGGDKKGAAAINIKIIALNEKLTETLKKYKAELAATTPEVEKMTAAEEKAVLAKRNKSLNLEIMSFDLVDEKHKLSELRKSVTKGLEDEFDKSKPLTLNIPVAPKLEITDTSGIKEGTQKMIMDISPILVNGLKGMAETAAATIGETIGTALAGGDIMAVGAKFMNAVAGIIEGIGQQMISLGIAAMLAKVALDGIFLNPALGIAAGVALIAVASGMRSAMSEGVTPFAQGGLAFGSTLGMVGEGIGTSRSNPEVIAPLDKLKSFMPQGGDGGGEVELRIKGNDLVAILNRQAKTSKFSR